MEFFILYFMYEVRIRVTSSMVPERAVPSLIKPRRNLENEITPPSLRHKNENILL